MSKTVYISFNSSIDQASVRVLMANCTNIVEKMKPDELYFLFSSGGGSVSDGIALYHFLKALPVKITMHNIGAVDSIATIIFLAGDDRYAATNSTFLFHGVTTGFENGERANLAKIIERKSSLEHDQKKMTQIIAKNSELTTSELNDLFTQGEAKDPAFAQDKAIISSIIDPVIPAGSTIVTVT